jgi:filamentous hemagglutinin family protein
MVSAKPARRDSLRPKVIALSVAACFSVSATQALANPTGGTVASGSAGFATSGNTLTITNTANTIINWQSFSIGPKEITNFLQSGSSSAVLNRVVGANGAIPQSAIDGVLSSNGRVFLINPSGIVIGAGATIDVAGFVASSLNLSDADFLAGKMRFTDTPGAGKVSNAGTIDTSYAGPGGQVWLVGPDVQNSGIIRSPQGEIVLAAGKTVELVSEGTPFVTVSITADSERALNLGQLIADNGKIGMFGALVRQSGVAQADSAIVGPNGEIRLVATKDLTLDAGSRTTANGASGGTVTLQAQGGTNLVYGTVEAKGSSGQGGTIEALGVRVGVLGNGVIDASGDAGGGTVLVGGDQHGANPNVQNAQQTLIGPDGVIRADAATTGDGGRVIVWSDAGTQVYGSLSARGGSQSGNGGFVETSSMGDMDLTGVRIDTRAPNGTAGTWLIDPLDVVIEPNAYVGGYALVGGIGFGVPNTTTTVHITEQTIENNFTTVGTTQIQASRDVLFNANLNLVYATVTPQQTLEVRAIGNINMAADGVAHTITTNGQNVVLSANDIGPNSLTPALNPTGTGSIYGGGNITTNGGNITLSGYGVSVGTLNTTPVSTLNLVPAGSVSVLTNTGDIVTGSITTSAVPNPLTNAPAGSVTLTTSYGNITVNGTIDARGANGFNARSSAQGSNGGDVILVRSTTLTAGKITVTGGILTYGGDGLATSAIINGQPNGGAGGYISIAANNSGGTPGQTTPVYGDVVVQGNMITRGGNGATSPTGVIGGNGGAGGVVLINASGNVQVGPAQSVVNASGGTGAVGSAAVSGTTLATSGGNGGSGGVISIYGGTVSIASGLITYGGAGGLGGLGTAVLGYGGGDGGAGGAGGTVTLNGTGAVVAAAITTTGGYGGAGGAASGAGAAGSGSSGGDGGAVSLASTGSYVNVGTILTMSGNAGNAGGTGGGTAFISAGFGGGVTISAATTISAGDIITSGGSAGIVGITLPGLMVAGGQGGAVNMNATGDINTGAITTTGGAGSTIAGGGAYAGNAGAAGNIVLGSNGSVTTGAIDLSGGGLFPSQQSATLGIGALVNITTGPITARALTPATYGGSVSLAGGSGQVTVNGNIDVRGANGSTTTIDTCGDACFTTFLGGTNGGSVTISRTGTTGVAIQVGSILASGGNGVSQAASAGGNGGTGGTVSTRADYGGAVSIGSIDVHGGSGADGKGGLVAGAYAGGFGGQGGNVTVNGSTSSTGDINAAGGAGGVGAADSGTVGASNGGNGGGGGGVSVSGISGTVAVGNITAAGGAGGAGGKGLGVLAGVGGNGGYGGSVTVQAGGYGDIDMTAGGSISVAGGAGGAGGAGDPVKGGNGGTGGNGGVVDLFSPNGSILVVAALNIDGTLLGGGAAPTTINVANGGTGGAGGADFGLGAGTVGVNGLPSPSISVTGTVEVTGQGGLDSNTIVQATNLLLQTNNAPPSDDKKDKDDKKKGIAACK